MKKIIFNKLVRDRIPDILKNNGSTFSIRILEGEEFKGALNQKLEQSIKNYLEDENIEELVEIVDLIKAILKYKDISYEEFEKKRAEIHNDKGVYNLKILLESIDERVSETNNGDQQEG